MDAQRESYIALLADRRKACSEQYVESKRANRQARIEQRPIVVGSRRSHTESLVEGVSYYSDLSDGGKRKKNVSVVSKVNSSSSVSRVCAGGSGSTPTN